MPILFDEAGQAYEAEIAQQVTVDDLTAELSRLDDEYANVKANIQEKIDIITAHNAPSTTDTPQADPEATASDESKSTDGQPAQDAQASVVEDTTPDAQPIDVPVIDTEAPADPTPTVTVADPTPSVIQDVTPAPALSVTTVDESAPVVTTTDSTPEVTTVTDTPSEPTVTPTVITLQ